jgi:hypothetical protein
MRHINPGTGSPLGLETTDCSWLVGSLMGEPSAAIHANGPHCPGLVWGDPELPQELGGAGALRCGATC